MNVISAITLASMALTAGPPPVSTPVPQPTSQQNVRIVALVSEAVGDEKTVLDGFAQWEAKAELLAEVLEPERFEAVCQAARITVDEVYLLVLAEQLPEDQCVKLAQQVGSVRHDPALSTISDLQVEVVSSAVSPADYQAILQALHTKYEDAEPLTLEQMDQRIRAIWDRIHEDDRPRTDRKSWPRIIISSIILLVVVIGLASWIKSLDTAVHDLAAKLQDTSQHG